MVKKDKFSYKKKSAWEIFNNEQIKKLFEFADEYKKFLNKAKTEREAINEITKYAKKFNKKIFLNKKSSAAIIVKGKKAISDGLRIVISHVDSPRLDLKQVPLFEDADSNLALLETHYYGGIKKFQWLTIPLSLHGIIIKKDGTKINFSIGEDEKDPVFQVADILPHLSHEIQDTKKINEAIKGESLDLIIGNIPIKDKEDEKDKIKKAILKKLYDKYGLIEEDFISAELEAVPAFNSRDIGFDNSLIGSYGQDDRSSAFCSLKAILHINKPNYTTISLFVDKEEIGSEGSTSAQSISFLKSIIKNIDSKADIYNVMLKSKVISADVNAAVTPNYTDVFELKNSASLGFGVAMSKFSGHGGKYAANDASAEYVSEIRTLLNKKKIPWQTGELGKVDKGGGGTVAKFFSRLGMEVIDLGVPVLSMHSPFEVTCKADIYSTYLAYKAFQEY
jgi:aspartyl aminopeptidase